MGVDVSAAGAAVAVVAMLVVLVVAVAVRRPVQRRLFSGTGFEQWRREASMLP